MVGRAHVRVLSARKTSGWLLACPCVFLETRTTPPGPAAPRAPGVHDGHSRTNMQYEGSSFLLWAVYVAVKNSWAQTAVQCDATQVIPPPRRTISSAGPWRSGLSVAPALPTRDGTYARTHARTDAKAAQPLAATWRARSVRCTPGPPSPRSSRTCRSLRRKCRGSSTR